MKQLWDGRRGRGERGGYFWVFYQKLLISKNLYFMIFLDYSKKKEFYDDNKDNKEFSYNC